PLTLREMTFSPQSVISSGTLAVVVAPLWATNLASSDSGLAQRFARVASAECGPIGRSTLKLVTGTSGTDGTVDVRRPFVVVVLRRSLKTPWPESGICSEGSVVPPPCATGYAVPLSALVSTGVT